MKSKRHEIEYTINPKLGSDVFGTGSVKTDEFILLAKTMTENGSSLELADLEIRFIDDLLSMQRMHIIVVGQMYTSKGRLRKNSHITDMFDSRVNLLMQDIQNLDKPKGEI